MNKPSSPLTDVQTGNRLNHLRSRHKKKKKKKWRLNSRSPTSGLMTSSPTVRITRRVTWPVRRWRHKNVISCERLSQSRRCWGGVTSARCSYGSFWTEKLILILLFFCNCSQFFWFSFFTHHVNIQIYIKYKSYITKSLFLRSNLPISLCSFSNNPFSWEKKN